jgi:multidrug transporter EmrE-like cation transporter
MNEQVLNGVAAIVAIQAAGLAVAQALWSGLSVFVAFLWGAAVFHEPVASLPLALAGALCVWQRLDCSS